jgi:DNA-directed RNA polymerase subunit RPC12/RpoP
MKKRDPKWVCPKCGGHRFVYLTDKRLRRVVLRTPKCQWAEIPQIVVYWSDYDEVPPWASGRTGYSCVGCKHDFGDRDREFRNSLSHVVPPQQPAVPQKPTPPVISELQLATLDDIAQELRRRESLSFLFVAIQEDNPVRLTESYRVRHDLLVPLLAKILHNATQDTLKEFQFSQ